MGVTPDRQSGPREEEELQLTDEGVDPSIVGAIVQKAGAILARDSIGIFNLRSGSGLTYVDFLLDCEPIAETGTPDASYAVTYSGNNATTETWRRSDATLVKSIDYTYAGQKITQEVRKVFASDGTTIVAQVTWTYAYTGNKLTSGTMTRNV